LLNKISNQDKVLNKYNFFLAKSLVSYTGKYRYFDSTNIEGVTAKIYFRKLFGKCFNRDDAFNEINHKLNYGYSLIVARIACVVTNYGYLTEIGIKHHCDTNNLNFPYDLIEPFRQIVDDYVYRTIDVQFDYDYKANMLGILKAPVHLNGEKAINLDDAIPIYISNCIRFLDNNESSYTEITYWKNAV